MIEKVNRLRTAPVEAVRLQPLDSRASERPRRHLLVPVTLTAQELPAIRMGLELAATTESRVTLLHVGGNPPRPQSRHWLDAIDRLHDSLSHSSASGDISPAETTIAPLKAFLASAGLSQQLLAGDTTLISRRGDFCETVLDVVQSQQVDVVVLPGDLLISWLPTPSARLRRRLQRIGKSVLAVWPESTHRFASASR